MGGVDWGLKVLGDIVAANLGQDGQIYVVDPRGGGDFLTMQEAVDACVDWNGDVIIRKEGTETVTEAVEFDTKGITVIAEGMGIPSRAQGERFMTYGSHTDGPAAVISAPCKLIGIGFCGSETAGASLEIDGTTGGFDGGNFASLINCRFSHWGIAKAHALILQGTGDVEIDNCYFDGYTAGYTVSAIQCELAGASGTWATYIHDCLFMNPTTYALKMKTGSVPVRGLVENNKVVGSGKFFDDNDVAGSWCFYGNWLPTATDTGSYGDTVDNLQTAGYDFADNHYAE